MQTLTRAEIVNGTGWPTGQRFVAVELVKREPCPWCASRAFGIPCPTHGGTDQDDAARPLVLVDITGGLETATYAYPGIGAPVVHVFDFDDETDYQERLADSLDMIATLIRERSEHPDDLRAAQRYERDAHVVRARER